MAYNGGYYLPSVSDEGILSWTPTVEGMAPIPEVNVRGPQGSDASVTAEAIQAVAPIAWSKGSNATSSTLYAVALGAKSSASNFGTSLGAEASSGIDSVAVGMGAKAQEKQSTVLGKQANATTAATAVGHLTQASAVTSVTIGTRFTETTDSGNVTHTCTTEGTGSITIGAGANTLNTVTTDVEGNETTVESSNAVTIGCKAENKGADSVVIGASASGLQSGSVAIGAGSETYYRGVSIGLNSYAGGQSVSLGNNAKARGIHHNIAIGEGATTSYLYNMSFGNYATTNGMFTTAIGYKAYNADNYTLCLASGGFDISKTQLYLCGANTPLANEYENGAAMMGYVVYDTDGKTILESGTRKLSELFTNNSTFQPATTDENGEWVMPKVFHPSNLDMPVEEPTEPEEYQPLPVYPIVEPEILEEI